MSIMYYTPKISEFNSDFEYEFRHCDYLESGWVKYSTPEFDPEKEDCFWSKSDLSEFRVKYLDREDIESLDWKREEFPLALKLFFTKEVERYGVKEKYSLLYVPKTSWVLIYKSEGYVIEHPDKITTTGTTVFAGEIKNKSELKQILKQIKL